MSFTSGARIGPYAIVGSLGAGGMGEVYRATDTTLGRQVAIKILPDAFAADPNRLARFEREAKTLASLSHSCIAAVYGFERSTAVHALVMELVEGDDLSQRIARGVIPLDEALPIAKQIADALEAAHEQGIIHRDLKPANIKVRPDGTVKVLDFGLAKALDSGLGAGDRGPEHASMAPTITTPAMMTGAGMILGTAAYMSPEQARGRVVDRRADIWAFGAVLFEMLTGRRAFPGEDMTDTIVSVVSKEPDWSALPPGTPMALRRLLTRCVKKDAKVRLRDIGDARVQLEELLSGTSDEVTMASSSTPAAPGARVAPRSSRAAWMACAAVALLAAGLAIPTVRHLRETPPPAPPEQRTEISTPATGDPESFALSPDGRQIVFAATVDGASRLWLRSLAATTAQPLTGTEGGRHPFWSPDSRSIGFFATGALKRLDLEGSLPQTLAPVLAGQGGSWSPDGTIVFAPSVTSALMRVRAAGGPATALGPLAPQQIGHVGPHFLPDGRHFLFTARGAPEAGGIFVGTLDGDAPTRLVASDGTGVYLGSGWLLWVRAGALVAQQFDAARMVLTGEPMTLANGVPVSDYSRSWVSVSAAGMVAYRTGEASQRQLRWFDRSGAARGTVGDPDATLWHPIISPDGHRVVVVRTVQGNLDLWLRDGPRSSRLTFSPQEDRFPVWSPDGARVVFRSIRTGQGDLYQKLINGAGTEERILASDQLKTPASWSADGRYLMYMSQDPETGTDLWVLPMEGERAPTVFLKTLFREAYGAFSPDGRWVAYQSDESGRPEVYVRPFDSSDAVPADSGASSGRWQVSTAGGILPRWRHDGKELYYLNPEGAMMAAPVTVTGSTFEPGAPMTLFPTRIYGGGADVQQGRQYDVAPDGRFLINTVPDVAAAPITLLQNWRPREN
ncbi:MAG: serine/threonine-protein kinase [Acidobacteria bacterium]|nr:serine/threonine-protein kinase [Acidobacteriota bacterium]